MSFTAATSTCGDGVVDAGLGEQCDGSATVCGAGQACNAQCTCVPFGSNKSGPIDLTADGRKLVVANIDTDTVFTKR